METDCRVEYLDKQPVFEMINRGQLRAVSPNLHKDVLGDFLCLRYGFDKSQ